MRSKHTREEILAAAVTTAFDVGLSRLSYGRVAAHLGIADRTVVYYFPAKEDLVIGVLADLGAQVQQTLAAAMPAPAADHLALLRVAWPVLARPRSDPVFALFFEANGLASAGHEPYRTVVAQLIDAWIAWLATLIDGDARHARTEAETAIAVVDGLLLLRQLGGAAAANRAARRLGIA